MRTKQIILIIPAFIIACSGSDSGSDAYGNFEAKEVIVSAEAQGKIIEFNLEEGNTIKK